MANQTKGSNLLKHGAYRQLRKYKQEKAISKRTTLGKFLHKTREGFIQDLGGQLSTAQMVLLDRVMEEILVLSILGQHAQAEGIKYS